MNRLSIGYAYRNSEGGIRRGPVSLAQDLGPLEGLLVDNNYKMRYNSDRSPANTIIRGEYKMTRRSNVTMLVSAAVGAALLILLALAFFLPGGGRPAPGDPAPDFDLVLLDGSEVSLSNLQGQVVVLNFWASWCMPCREEAPDLQAVWETYRDKDVVLLGIGYKDAADAMQAFMEEFRLTYPNGVDPQGRIGRAYGVTAVPETFVIDAAGRVARFYVGQVSAADLAQQLAQLVAP